jgi:hypothetical protein
MKVASAKVVRILSLCIAAALTVSAQVTEHNSATDEHWVANNPTYSAAVMRHQSPEAFFAEEEGKLGAVDRSDDPEMSRFLHLPSAAKDLSRNNMTTQMLFLGWIS